MIHQTLKGKFLAPLFFMLICQAYTSVAQEYRGTAAQQIISGTDLVILDQSSGLPTFVLFDENHQLDPASFKNWFETFFGARQIHSTVFGAGETDDLGFSLQRYQQNYAGYPVLGSMYIVHQKDGKVQSINGRFFNKFNAVVSPSISESSALQLALNKVGATTYKWQVPEEEQHIKDMRNDPQATFYPKGKLIFAPLKGDYLHSEFRLCWQFDVFASKPFSRQNIYVDATSGDIVYLQNEIESSNSNGTAVTAYSGTQNIVSDSYSGHYRLRENPRGTGSGMQTWNMQQGTSYGSSVDFTDTDNNWNNVNPQHDEVATDAHWGAEMTYDYYKAQHNRNSFDNAGAVIMSYVHFDVDYDNAFWDGYEMTYGDGYTFLPLTGLDVCGHEISHAVCQYTANLDYVDESGALNESNSDIMGNTIEAWARPTQHSWIIGEDITVGGVGLRDMSNPNVFQNPDTYQGTYWDFSTQEVHNNSGVGNFWYYLLVAGGSGTNDIGNAFTVTGIGFTDAAKIQYRAMSVYETPTTQYADARTATIQAAIDLFGTCSTQEMQVANAWYAVGVGTPLAVTANFSFSQAYTCTLPQTVTFTNLSLNATSYVWNFGDGATSSSTNPSHAYSSYGNYTVTLTATGGACGSDVHTQTLTINPLNQSALPLIENFDAQSLCSSNSNCGTTVCPLSSAWQNAANGIDDDIDWRVFNAPTPSTGTGPDADHTTGTGNYVYLEASSCFTKTAILTSSCFDFTGVLLPQLSFAYHMYGANMGSLYVEINNGGSWINLWSMTGNQGNQWTVQNLSLSTYSNQVVQIRFRGVTGTGLASDMALDDIQVVNLAVPPVVAFSADITNTCESFPVQFTDLSSNSPTAWQWSFSPATVAYLNGTSSTSQNPKVGFNASGNYNVQLIASNVYGSDTLTQSSYITIGAVAALPMNENFESQTLCSGNTNCGATVCPFTGSPWANEANGVEDQSDWRVFSGATATANTGPDFDHTTGAGKYIYLESTSCYSSIAMLKSQCIDLTNIAAPQLNFWYHMYGATMGSLKVHVISSTGDVVAWTKTGNQGNQWSNQILDLSAYANSVIQIIFEGTTGTGTGGTSDMALDDIDLYNFVAPPIANFTSSGTITCPIESVQFTDLTTNFPSSWLWSFSPSTITYMNGTSATSQNPVVQFNVPGTYNVQLVAYNVNGSDTATQAGYITCTTGTVPPITENFDQLSLCSTTSNCGTTVCPLGSGWYNEVNGVDDASDWRVYNAPTPSSSTGPDADHTTGTGNYVYLESTTCNNSQALLSSNCIFLDTSEGHALRFWYHMYGAGMGTLKVHIVTATNDVVVFTQTGNLGNQWLYQFIDLTPFIGSTVKIVFDGTTGTGGTSDMALDDINVFNYTLPPAAGFSSDITSACVLDAFHFTDLSANYPSSWQWSFSPSNVTYQNGTSSTSQNPVVKFNTAGSYNVQLIASNVNGSDTVLHTNYITTSAGTLPPILENFDGQALCSTSANCGTTVCPISSVWTNEVNGTEDQSDWRVYNAPTPTTLTGPDADHTTGTGNYIYLESSTCNTSQALLKSDCIFLDTSEGHALRFWYHMYGAGMGTLKVHIVTLTGDDIVFTQTGNQGNQWLYAFIDLTPYIGSTVRIIFDGTTGTGGTSDMALDDINVFNYTLPPVAGFTSDITSGCILDAFHFTDLSANYPSSWQWSFSPSNVTYLNGTSSTSQNPVVQFNAAGTYSVQLIALNVNGSDTLTQSNYITTTAGTLPPFDEDFDGTALCSTASNCGTTICPISSVWSNELNGTDDQIDWRVYNAPTPTALTGPDFDHTSGAGNYIYLESTTCYSNSAKLSSGCVHLVNIATPVLGFWYHMYGATMGTLKVHIISSSGDAVVWTKTGNQGNQWVNQLLNLSPYIGSTIDIVFEGITGSGTGGTSDMALDDINLYDFTSPPIAAFTSNVTSTCTIESVQFTDQTTNFPVSWQWSFSPSTITYLNGTSSTSENPLVQFNTPGTYNVQLIASNGNGNDTIVHTSYINASAGTPLPVNENFDLLTACSTSGCGATLCPLNSVWTNETNGVQDVIDWRVLSGATPTASTGPDHDHTTGTTGKYVYLESTTCYSSNALLTSGCLDLSNSSGAVLSFWYHMYGATMGTLKVHLVTETNDSVVWSLSGNQGNQWVNQVVNLSGYAGSTIKIVFEGITGTAGTSDMALDDIDVWDFTAPPTTAFTANVTSTCLVEPVQFTDQSTNYPAGWQWSFSPSTVTYLGGTNSTSQDPLVLFNATGNYTVQLITSNGNGNDTLVKPAYINVTGGALLPLSENFDLLTLCSTTGCGATLCPLNSVWVNETNGVDDVIDWRVYNAPTPSSATGPDADHTTGSGKYIYLEASACYNSTALLRSECIDLTNATGPLLSFWYHMYGAAMGTMNVHVISGGQDTVIWTKTGDQGNTWFNATLNLSSFSGSTVQIIFEGITGAQYTSDMALDDIDITNFNAVPVAAFTADITATCPLNQVHFTDQSTNFANAWQWSFTPSTVTYMSGTNSTSQNPIVRFDNPGTYDVRLIAFNANGSDTVTHLAYINVSGGSTLPLAENFDALTICSTTGCGATLCPLNSVWINETNGVDDVIDWRVYNLATPTSLTGPDFDHTTGSGKYIYLESTTCFNSVGRLKSGCINLSSVSNPGLSFWYHMYGATMGSLKVHVVTATTDTIVWTMSGDHGNQWLNQNISLTSFIGQTIQIVFEGTTGTAGTSDMALDDIDIEDFSALPVVNFSSVATPGCGNTVVQFTDLSLNFPSSWQWSFNPSTISYLNGTNSTSQNPTVMFNLPGAYSVQLIATNVNGSDTLSQSAYITVTNGTVPPITENFDVMTTCTTAANCESDVCPLSNGWVNGVNLADDDIDWRVNTGATPSVGTGPDSDHTSGSGNYVYLEASGCLSYTAWLTSPCADLTGAGTASLSFWYHMYGTNMGTLHLDVVASDSVHHDVIAPISGDHGNAWIQQAVDLSQFSGQVISVRFRGVTGDVDFTSDMALDDINLSYAPVATFTYAPTTGCVSDTFLFTDQSSGVVTSYQWNFGSGANPASANTQGPHWVVYSNPGTKNVSLITGNSYGSSTFNQSIVVDDVPTSGFTYSINGATAIFSNTTVGGTTYVWNFGDGFTPSSQDPSHTYSASGTYDVMLISTNVCGNDTFTETLSHIEIGIHDIDVNIASFDVMPNPSDGIFNLDASQTISTELKLEIFDVRPTIWNNTIDELSKNQVERIDLSEFAAGIYHLKIQTADGITVKKLVIQ